MNNQSHLPKEMGASLNLTRPDEARNLAPYWGGVEEEALWEFLLLYNSWTRRNEQWTETKYRSLFEKAGKSQLVLYESFVVYIQGAFGYFQTLGRQADNERNLKMEAMYDKVKLKHRVKELEFQLAAARGELKELKKNPVHSVKDENGKEFTPTPNGERMAYVSDKLSAKPNQPWIHTKMIDENGDLCPLEWDEDAQAYVSNKTNDLIHPLLDEIHIKVGGRKVKLDIINLKDEERDYLLAELKNKRSLVLVQLVDKHRKQIQGGDAELRGGATMARQNQLRVGGLAEIKAPAGDPLAKLDGLKVKLDRMNLKDKKRRKAIDWKVGDWFVRCASNGKKLSFPVPPNNLFPVTEAVAPDAPVMNEMTGELRQLPATAGKSLLRKIVFRTITIILAMAAVAVATKNGWVPIPEVEIHTSPPAQSAPEEPGMPEVEKKAKALEELPVLSSQAVVEDGE